MALSAGALGSLIDSNLSGFGATGSNRTVFSNAVAAGIVMTIVGKAFATTDIGTVPGTGSGTGTGLIGMSASSMASIAVGVLPTTGVNADPLMQAIMNAVVAHLGSNTTLTSTHAPVFLGVGTVVVGSIPVTIPEMAGNIDSQLSSAGAAGSNRTVLSNAIATGVVSGVLLATGTVVITGSPAGIPVPGAGSGSGVIS